MTWYKENLEYYNEFKNIVKIQYPSLHQSIVEGNVTLSGMLYLYNCDGKELDRYNIKIICFDTYPILIPEVHEIGGRIPKIADRHFYPKKTKACLLLEDEKYKYYNQNISIAEFIKEIVEPFFLSQTYYELTGKWLFGERNHGVLGIIEFYKEILKTEDLEVICKFLSSLQNDKIKGHWICFCGSNHVLRKCHFELLKDYRTKVSKEVVRSSLKRILSYSDNERKRMNQASQMF